MNVTILTPTYNREKQLNKLYESLLKQTNKEFLWYVIDDGSSDDTESNILKYQKQGKIKIEYRKKENAGKHTAINLAIKYINTPLVFIVDSDDWLKEDAVQTIIDYYEKYKNNKEICGFSFLRMFPNGEINNKMFDINEKIDTYIESRINSGIEGDKAEVYYSDVLKKHPFPEYDNEKFISEDIIWIDIALKYKMVHINKAIYVGEYLQNGLTNSGLKLKLNNPRGMYERAKRWMYKDIKFKCHLKGYLMCLVYGKLLNYRFKYIIDDIQKNENINLNKVLLSILYFPALIILKYWKLKIKRKE